MGVLPWRMLLKQLASRHGFLDPLHLLDRLRRFAQPSEVGEPLELLRAGAVFHARGLINTRVIQYNLDWVWPYWVEKQFNPRDPSFVPRGFSITHINMTHRNWTAVGLPDSPTLPIVDPAGLVTPFYDGWSIDAVIQGEDEDALVPSKCGEGKQFLDLETGLAVVTEFAQGDFHLTSRAEVHRTEKGDTLVVTVRAQSKEKPGRLVIALRPYNPEGISLIDDIAVDKEGWVVSGKEKVRFSHPPDRQYFSNHQRGDVLANLTAAKEGQKSIHCPLGLATSAASYALTPQAETEIRISIDLSAEARPLKGRTHVHKPVVTRPWDELNAAPGLAVPNRRMGPLYQAALKNLILHAPWGVVVPGPYTYRRFWFRDAAFILDALLTSGLFARVKSVLATYAKRQESNGYFLSQDGEWDSNGEALWILNRYELFTGEKSPALETQDILRGGQWIIKKRLSCPEKPLLHGLMPAGFSAEHLGPNDHYYWDAYWSQAGLEAVSAILERRGQAREAEPFRKAAKEMAQAIGVSVTAAREAKQTGDAIPASPHRRMDAGAIGSLACGYPLQLVPGRDKGLFATVEWLWQNHTLRGSFFQDMIHSGINPYLTLHMAQVFLRADDARHWPLAESVMDVASPTGQWPEAIHPNTLGGCMGDGQHIWAAAEWIRYLRNLFLREEGKSLVLGQGLIPAWLESGEELSFGPAPCEFGTIQITVQGNGQAVEVKWEAKWRVRPERLLWKIPGTKERSEAPEASGTLSMMRE